MAGAKKVAITKNQFFMPVNYAKGFLDPLHTGVIFSDFFFRASNGHWYSRSWNFQLKISLCSVFQHAEFKFHGCSWIWEFRVCIIVKLLNALEVETYRWFCMFFFLFWRLWKDQFHEHYIIQRWYPEATVNPVLKLKLLKWGIL